MDVIKQVLGWQYNSRVYVRGNHLSQFTLSLTSTHWISKAAADWRRATLVTLPADTHTQTQSLVHKYACAHTDRFIHVQTRTRVREHASCRDLCDIPGT